MSWIIINQPVEKQHVMTQEESRQKENQIKTRLRFRSSSCR